VAETCLHNRHEVRDAVSAVDHQPRHQPCHKRALPQGSLAGASHHTTCRGNVIVHDGWGHDGYQQKGLQGAPWA